jgi:enoyl-CoA hydratase/carnithine racemase
MQIIRMQHPAKNALGSDLMGWLEAEIARTGTDSILLTGSADAFSAGLDLKEVAGLDAGGMERFLRRMDALALRLWLHPAPTAACINGHAIAGGCVMALCCDHRVAGRNPKTKIGVNEVAIGACFPPAILRIVASRLSPAARDRLMLGAGLHDVDSALALGLIDEIADDPELAATQRLQALSAHPSATYAVTKTALRAEIATVSAADEKRFREQEVPIWSSTEMKARVAAVLGRR